MNTKRLSASLVATQEKGQVWMTACAACKTAIAPVSQSWKEKARLDEAPLNQVDGIYTTADDVVVRRFFCPSCGTLLDAETATQGDPFLEDRIKV
ncbi:MAG: acetone carboxylase subunit gamma [Alphaproteobacteria bacterium]